MLSESFLNADAAATAQMVAQQEALLQQEVKINEKEKQKFVEIVNERDIELINTPGKDEHVATKEIIPNVYDNYDAETGAKITEAPLFSDPKSAADKSLVEAASLAWPDLAQEKTESPKKEEAPKAEPISASAQQAMAEVLSKKDEAPVEPSIFDQVGSVMTSVIDKVFDEAKDIMPKTAELPKESPKETPHEEPKKEIVAKPVEIKPAEVE